MKIFADEFVNWLTENTVCRLKGHKSSDWMQVMWAPGHFTGYQVKQCLRCNKELDRTKDGRGWEEYKQEEN